MGGTEMNSCVRHVLQSQKPDPSYKRQVIMITDAGVYDYDRLIKCVENNYENSGSHQVQDPQNRMFVLGVGNGVSTSLCKALAKAGGGQG